MTVAFVLGNGISRKGISGAWLKMHGVVYGCNAIYREFTPDVLIATDRPIATHIQNIGYAKEYRFHTRTPIEGSGALRLYPSFHKYSSGLNAVGMAIVDGNKDIFLIGFDMGPTTTQKFNNMYAGSDFYKEVNSEPTFSGSWVKQLQTITKDYPMVNFYRVFGKTTAKIEEFDRIKNLTNLDLDSFVDKINTQKDI